jgi:predicted RNA-binding Zn-ribbon protein involved in translation (DUF1610 family)
MRPVSVVALAFVLGSAASAAGAGPTAGPPSATTAPTTTTQPLTTQPLTPTSPSASSSASSTPSSRTRLNPVLCGCASSRFLARGPVTLHDRDRVGAWLHLGARLDGFARAAEAGGPLQPTTLPTTTQRLPADVDDADGDALVVVRAAGAGEGLLGIMRPREAAPRELLAVTLRSTGAALDDAAARPPVLDALWLAPTEARDRPPCGAWRTLRTAFQARQGAPAVEAFAVRDVDTGVQRLVDARHVGAFGLGEVPACRHGFPVADHPQTLELVPVGADGARGEPWVLRHDGRGGVDVVRVASPASADATLLADPFPVPGAPPRRFSWMSVGGMWTLSALLGLVCGVVGYLFWRFRRRRMQDVRCASCGAAIPVDVLDDKTDGFFCPACGTAGVWKGRRRVDVDVTRL